MNQPTGIDLPSTPEPLEWIDAEEAAALLEVKRSTLYAYASRGMLRSVPVEGSRQRRYARADLDRLRARKRARQSDAAHAASALRFGEPVLDTELCSIGAKGHAYRGVAALSLAEDGVPFESVCELLWADRSTSRPVRWGMDSAPAKAAGLAAFMTEHSRPLDGLALALVVASQRAEDRFDTSSEGMLRQARIIVQTGIASLGLAFGAANVGTALKQKTSAESFLATLGVGRSKSATRAANAALVVIADHELNSSAFAARVAASVGADLYASTLAAVSTLSGPIHGGACERVEAMLEEMGSPDRAVSLVRDRLRRGSRIPGFGHPLYPDGDPRAAFLLEMSQRLAPKNKAVRSAVALSEAMALAGNEAPNVDLGLCALAGALHLPKGGGLAMFAAGRLAGWIAHALEQRALGYQLRPRARYVGR